MKGQKLTKGSDEQLPNWMKENGMKNWRSLHYYTENILYTLYY